jgi:preprotein translocase subunit SecD
MTMKKVMPVAAVAVVAAGAFWAGSEYQKALYDDRCLDLGGGRNPGQYPICVVELQDTALWLGPIKITQNDVVEFELQQAADGQSQARLELTPEIASQLNSFTENSIGQNLNIRIGGQLVNSVHIAETIQGTNFILALSEAQAKKLAKLLAPNTR